MPTKTPDWDKNTQPIVAAGMLRRDGQAVLGQMIFDAINNKSTLVGAAPTGTGKSVAAAIPLIVKVLEHKKIGKTFRGAISTETITLQNQIAEKDLPFLYSLYPGFTFKKLMGRSNYLCLNMTKMSAYDNNELKKVLVVLEVHKQALGSGEIKAVEKAVGISIDEELWSKICGSQNFCIDNDCAPEDCFAAQARSEALEADIVIVNHALLGIDAELKSQAQDAFAEGLLGPLNTLIVDEAHALEPVLVKQWTTELSHWQVANYVDSMVYSVDRCTQIKANASVNHKAQMISENIYEIFDNLHNFFEALAEEDGEEWAGYSSAVSEKNITGSVSFRLAATLDKYEVRNMDLLNESLHQLLKVKQYTDAVWDYLSEFAVKVKQRRKFSKGLRAIRELISILDMLIKALRTKNGIIDDYGKTGVIFDGWVKKDKTHGMTLRMVPLDVSLKASNIWKTTNSSILLSATLADLTDGSFKYARRCVGFPNGPEINVTSPFDYATKQLIYITKANGQKVENAQYCLEELVALVKAVDGRSLILFTAKKELEAAAEALRSLRFKKQFDYKILVQEEGANKQKLLEEFKKDTHSILLGLKSFFVGVDVPGEALSHVAICKFPLAQFSIECRMRMTVWAEKGFPKWYERESLTTLAQAAGRLIRTTDDHGVISLLDFRIVDPSERVYNTAVLGVNALGSPITREIEDVHTFMQKHIQTHPVGV